MTRKNKKKSKGKKAESAASTSQGEVESQPESSASSADLPKQGGAPSIRTLPTPLTAPKETTDSQLHVQVSSEQFLSHPSTSSTPVEEIMERMGLEMKHERASDWPFPKRPGVGTKGRKINLVTNHFRIDLPEGYIYHYDIVLSNLQSSKKTKEKKKYRCLNTKESREVLEAAILSATNNKTHIFYQVRPAYDGKKNLYTRNPLPLQTGKPKEIPIKYDNKEYVIEIKPAERKGNDMPVISLEPLHQLFRGRALSITEEMRSGIMALETILKHGPALKYVPVYRSFYYQPREGDLPPIGGGREIWLGYHQSLHISQWKPMLNIDTSASTFYKSCPVTTHVMNILYPRVPEERMDNELRRIRALSDSQIRELLQNLRMLQIEVTHLSYPRKYRIHDITLKGACDVYFEEEINGKKVKRSVADYFRIKYHALKYPNLPCINGTKEKNTYLPLEVCKVISQHCNKEPTDEERKEIIKHTCFPPELKFRKIKQRVDICKEDLEKKTSGSASFAKEFGIRINTTPTKLTGRVLDPPYLKYNLPQPILPTDGVWSMQQRKFYQCCPPIKNWMLVSFSNFCGDRDLKRIADSLIEGGSVVGIQFAKPILLRSFGSDTPPGQAIAGILKEFPGIQLAVTIVPPKQQDKSVYREIKIFCETKFGLMTQCIVDGNAKKCNRNIVSNICQKINAKMGGRNTYLAPPTKPVIFQKPVLIIGADCTHPSPGDTVDPSIAAVVGSLDSGPTKYHTSLRIQMPEKKESGNGEKSQSKDTKSETKAKEVIVELKDMVYEVLMGFYEYTKSRKPEKIIFYRDGVSEGEFKEVLKKEVKQVKDACLKVNSEYKPPITFIVVGKRHHTRFRPELMDDARGGKGNVPPGTTVDTEVTHPLYYDYFLCSHLGIQGTSRPAHYTVIWDDNNFTPDELQELTYYLCYTSARCTRSISIPCPVMYAHLVAYRAKQYLYHFTKDKSRSDSLGKGDLEKMKEAIKVVDKIKNEMYFA